MFALKKVTTCDGEGTVFTYFVGEDGYTYLPVAGIKELTLNRKQWSRIARGWSTPSMEAVQSYFQEQAAEISIRKVCESKLLDGEQAKALHFTSQGRIHGDKVYVFLGVKKEEFEGWLLSAKCGNCNEMGDQHAAGACLFHPTRYVAENIALMLKIQAILDVPPDPKEVVESYARNSDSSMRNYQRTRLKGSFTSRSMWRKAKLCANANALYLQTPQRERGELVRPLEGDMGVGRGYTLDALTVELTPDVLAFVKRVNELTAGTLIKELRAKANKLPRAFPAYGGSEKILAPEGRPKIHLTYLPVGRKNRKKVNR